MALTFQIYAMTLRLSAMVEEKMKEIINGWNSAVKQRKNSPRQAAQSSYINSIASRYKFLLCFTHSSGIFLLKTNQIRVRGRWE